MGKRGSFSYGGGSRKSSKRELARYVPKAAKRNLPRLTLDVVKDIALAQAYYDANAWDECLEVIERLKKSGFAEPLIYNAEGSCLLQQGRVDDALKCFQKSYQADRTSDDPLNSMITILDVVPGRQAEALALRKSWWKRHGAEKFAKCFRHVNDRDPERPLRVGYIGGDFQYHSASAVFHRIITEHTEAVQPFIYSSTPKNKWDTVTNTYMAMPGWRDVSGDNPSALGWPHALLADKIRADRIDIIVDLSNFTHHSRFQTMAYKPAPIQLSGWGYALATGFPCMDGLLTDRVVNPVREPWMEPLVYLPSLIDYGPTNGLPEPGELPLVANGYPTFGVFQRSMKLNDDDLSVYAELLRRLPGSRVIFKSHYSERLKERIRAHFDGVGDRLEIRGATSSFEHKSQLLECDICLDTWPQTAGVTCCDSLHMGVPLVTLTADIPIQRVSHSLLANVGLMDFVTTTREDFIQCAINWVTNRTSELAYHRKTLRQRFAASPICAGYLEAVEETYRELWRGWCAQPLSIEDAMYRLEQAS